MAPGEPGDAAGSELSVQVVCCAGRGQVDATALVLPAGATLGQAIEASGVLRRHPGLTVEDAGIHGRLAPAARPLRDGDRVELYRPLQVAPMEARRSRHREQRRGRGGRPLPPG